MKKGLMLFFVIGLVALGSVGVSNAYTISGNIEVGQLDTLLAAADLGNSGDSTELTWVQSVLGISVTWGVKYDTPNGNGWVDVVDEPSGENYFAHLLTLDPGYYLIKTGNLKVTKNDTFLFYNNEKLGWAVIDLEGMGFRPKDITNIGKLSHVDEFNPGNAVPEPATMLLFGTGLIGLAGIARRKRS